jgi:tetratricopeptide (TPR) repeat protein
VYRKGKVKLSKEARNRLLEELADNPSAVKVYLNTAEMLASGGDFDAAEKEFDKARSIEPDSSSIENGLGLVGVAREYSEEAKLHFRRAIQFDPANITAHVNLAFLLGSDGSLSEAEQQMREAVELAPRYPDLRVQLATILMEREKLDEAVEHLRKALLINPRYVFAAFMLASIFLAKKRYHEVLEVYSGLDVDAIALPEIYSHLATSHLEIGSAETALEIAKKAIASDDPLPSSFVCMVLAHHKLGMTEEALACAEEYIKRFPDGPEIEEIKKLRDIMKNAAT